MKRDQNGEGRALAEAAVRDRQRQRDAWEAQKALHEHTDRCREYGACPYRAGSEPIVPAVEDVLRRMG